MNLIILALLKFLGLGIGTVTSVWGLTQKITEEDSSGRKRLTAAGQVSLGLACGSFTVAACALGLETVNKYLSDRNALLEADQARQARERDIQRGKAERAAELRAQAERDFQTRAENHLLAARHQATLAGQRLLLLEKSEEERRRDQAFAARVDRQAEQTLQRAATTLGQIERLMQPITEIQLTVTWEMPLRRWMGSLRELAQTQTAATIGRMPDIWGYQTEPATGKALGFQFRNGFSLYPRMQPGSTEVAMALIGADANVGFYAQPNPNPTNGLADADLRFLIWAGTTPELSYDVRHHSLSVDLTMRANTEITRSGRIVSVGDLEKAQLALQIWAVPALGVPHDREALRVLQMGMRPTYVRLKVSGREYRAEAQNISSVEPPGQVPVFLPRLTLVR